MLFHTYIYAPSNNSKRRKLLNEKDLKLLSIEWIYHDWNCQQLLAHNETAVIKQRATLLAYGTVCKIKSVVQADRLICYYNQQVIATTSLASPLLSPTLPSVAHLIHTNNSSAANKQTLSAESTDDD